MPEHFEECQHTFADDLPPNKLSCQLYTSFTPINGETYKISAQDTENEAEITTSDSATDECEFNNMEAVGIPHRLIIEAAERLLAQNIVKGSGQPRGERHYLRGPAKMKQLAQFPTTNQDLPTNWTLYELCRDFPTHLVGSNLVPFLQHGWSASKIARTVQDANPFNQIILTSSTIASRLRRLKVELGEDLREILMQACGHEDGSPKVISP